MVVSMPAVMAEMAILEQVQPRINICLFVVWHWKILSMLVCLVCLTPFMPLKMMALFGSGLGDTAQRSTPILNAALNNVVKAVPACGYRTDVASPTGSGFVLQADGSI